MKLVSSSLLKIKQFQKSWKTWARLSWQHDLLLTLAESDLSAHLSTRQHFLYETRLLTEDYSYITKPYFSKSVFFST